MRYVIEHVFGDGHVDRTAIDAADLTAAAETVLRRADVLGIRNEAMDDSLPVLLRLCDGPVTRITISIVSGGLAPKASQRSSAR